MKRSATRDMAAPSCGCRSRPGRTLVVGAAGARGRSGIAPGESAPARSPFARRRRHAAIRGKGCTRAIEPIAENASAFAPATVANLGPGFDLLGCAIEGRGDTVIASPWVIPAGNGNTGRVLIDAIDGDNGRLSLTADENCAGIAARETLALIEQHAGSLPDGLGVRLTLTKGLPLGSGMGSSAASAAAGAMATNLLFDSPLPKDRLVEAGMVSEAFVSGYHADNIAPALLGGFILIKSTEPLIMQVSQSNPRAHTHTRTHHPFLSVPFPLSQTASLLSSLEALLPIWMRCCLSLSTPHQ